ncbi:MAG: MOSC domain-containing protein [Acidimicrobiales bacterium]
MAADAEHRFTKAVRDEIRLLAGLGVEGDAHLGVTVQHRSRVAKDPTQPNLRQVHLVGAELGDRLRSEGFAVDAGQIGENVVTRGIDLLGLPIGTCLRLGSQAEVEVTGLRNPCRQLEGLQAALLDRDDDGHVVRLAGVMAIVLTTGVVRPGDAVAVVLPDGPHRPLGPI